MKHKLVEEITQIVPPDVAQDFAMNCYLFSQHVVDYSALFPLLGRLF